ncbi:MAG: apolipoprotein N-acyltransferase, partial [Gammaproteobacteria bacterium]
MLRALFALAAGAAYALAFAPYGMHPVAILALAVLFELWRDATPRQAAWRGWWFGLGMFGHGAWWVQVSIHQFGLPLYTFSVTMTVLFILFIAALFVASV